MDILLAGIGLSGCSWRWTIARVEEEYPALLRLAGKRYDVKSATDSEPVEKAAGMAS